MASRLGMKPLGETFGRSVLVGISLALAGCAHVKSLPPGEALTIKERQEAIGRASVWSPTDVAKVDFKRGPLGDGAFAFNERVTCNYKERKAGGTSPKFTCVTDAGDELKVKYGPKNAEVFGEVLSTRLFWALGFGADRMYPVRIVCHGCPNDPEKSLEISALKVVEFDPAAIERKMPGRALETDPDSGWKWSELENIGPQAPPNSRAQRDALKLLAAFVQHTDSKSANQRLLCPKGQEIGKTGCSKPVLMVSDLGLTFGEAGFRIKNKDSVSLDTWAEVPVWKEGAKCVALLKGSFTGSFSSPTIGEPGRAFLAGLLDKLTDSQLHDLFESARVKRRSSDPGSAPETDGVLASVDGWVTAFKRKRAQIADRRCPE